MSKYLKILIILVSVIFVLFLAYIVGTNVFGDSKNETPKKNEKPPQSNNSASTVTPEETIKPVPQINLSEVKPNESGKIMVVMFHNFVKTFTPKKYDKGDYTTTFDDFRKLLENLYDKGYRLISFEDYLKGNISVPAGCIPMVFTFDDGTAGQFNLVKENVKLVVNKDSAVGVMEEFNKIHPDFGLKGTFYVNLGDGTFVGEGTLDQRLKYLVGKGFEIGNHTYNHVNLKTDVKTVDQIQMQIGENQKKMYELIQGYKMDTFSLPFGEPSKNLQAYVVKGEYEGVGYEHKAIVEVGWDPALSPFNLKFDPLATHRVRATGINPVQSDLEWWLNNLSRTSQYVSDGNPDTVTVPKEKSSNIDNSLLKGKKLITY